MSAQLPLRDVHLPPAPGLWPPAPGWWVLAAAILVLLAIPLLLYWRRRRQRRAWQRQFTAELHAAGEGPPRLAAMSALLRRAARRQRAGSELLRGEAWLQLLDPEDSLTPAQRSLLCDGAYQPHVDPVQLAVVERWAAKRYLALLQERAR